MIRAKLRMLLLTGMIVLATTGAAQAAHRQGYSYLTYTDSDVSLVSKSEEDGTARANMPIGTGDHLSTGRSSRAEAILADGNVIRFDSRTEVRFDRLANTHESEDDRDLLFLQNGAVSVEVRFDVSEERAIRIDTPDASVVLSERGLFRIDAGRRGTEVYVLAGNAKILARSGSAAIRRGEYAFVSGSEEIEVDRADAPVDRFTRFIDERRSRRHQSRERGVQYLAEAGAADYDYDYDAAAFDDYGSWSYVSAFGRNCWRPRVGGDWRPYSLGYWRSSPCGLTWVSYESWGWLPYHYGSWSFDVGAGWCWLPGAAYSPAWVYWNYTPNYLGWCPVGYYGYYDNYYRSTRNLFGSETGLSYPHLRGAVDINQISQAGWNYAEIPRIGARLDRGQILRGDRVAFAPGDRGMIVTAPLRVERGGSLEPRNAIQEAVRRVPIGDSGLVSGARSVGTAGTPIDSGLTAILRRQPNLPSEGQALLRTATVQAGRDPGYRALPADQLVGSPRRIDNSPAPREGGLNRRGDTEGRRVTAEAPSQRAPVSDGSGSRSGWRESSQSPSPRSGSRTEAPASSGREEQPVRRSPARGDEGWRSQGSAVTPRSVEAPREERSAPRRDDGGWRAPHGDAPRSREDAPRQREEVRREAPRSETRHDSPSPRSYDAPRQEAPAPRAESPRPERQHESAPPPHNSERYQAPAPRSEAPRTYETPRTYEAPRAEPRHEAPARSYEAPRNYEAPRQAAPPPSQAQAPHMDAPRPVEGRRP